MFRATKMPQDPNPGEVVRLFSEGPQSKTNDLVDKQRASTLTYDQATELKQVFPNAASKGGPGGPGEEQAPRLRHRRTRPMKIP
jgi:hypothetical protein